MPALVLGGRLLDFDGSGKPIASSIIISRSGSGSILGLPSALRMCGLEGGTVSRALDECVLCGTSTTFLVELSDGPDLYELGIALRFGGGKNSWIGRGALLESGGRAGGCKFGVRRSCASEMLARVGLWFFGIRFDSLRVGN